MVQENFAHPIPQLFADEEAAPLLCAGAVGYRSLRLTGMTDGQIFGLVEFGASAHLVLQMARLVINAIRKEEMDKEALFKLNYATHL